MAVATMKCISNQFQICLLIYYKLNIKYSSLLCFYLETVAYFSERELAKDDVMLLQDTKTRLSTHISELEQELKRFECLVITN